MGNEHGIAIKCNDIKEKMKNCVEYTMALSRIFLTLNQGPFTIFISSFNIEPMKEMGPKTLVHIVLMVQLSYVLRYAIVILRRQFGRSLSFYFLRYSAFSFNAGGLNCPFNTTVPFPGRFLH